MKSKSLILFLLCVSALQGYAQKTVKESLPVTAPILIDGAIEEWNTEWLLDPKSSILYNVANDQDFLFIRLKISDATNQQKILLYGMSLYLNPEGGTKRGKVGLGYPTGKTSDELKAEKSRDSQNPRPWSQIKSDFIRDAEMLELIGLDKHPIVTPRIGLMNGLEVTMGVDQFSDLIYEAKIPFKAFRLDKSKISELGIVLVTGRMQVKMTSGNSGSYYHGVRYAAPPQNMSNPFTSSTVVHFNVKLN